MTARTAALIVLFAAAAHPGAAQDVKVDWDRSAPFPIYKTYSWGKDTRLTGNLLVDRRIVDAIDRQLHAQGLQCSESADVLLAAHVTTRDRALLHGFYGDWRGSDWAGVGTTGILDELTQGALIVDLYDAGTGRLVWRAMATGAVSRNPEENDKRVSKTVGKMFKSFPVPAPAR
jgi:hypothetical protein